MSYQTMNNSFLRALDTNLKYSGLVTLAMNLSKEKNVYEVTNHLAEAEGVCLQKNYSVVILRIAYLLKNRLKTLNEVFGYLESNHSKCIEQKFQKSLSKAEIQTVQEKCEYDTSILKRAFIEAHDNQNEAAQIFIGLYCDALNRAARQQKEARRLAKIMVNVFNGQDQLAICDSIKEKKSSNMSDNSNTQKNSCSQKLNLLNGQDQSHQTEDGDLQLEDGHVTVQKIGKKVDYTLSASENSPESCLMLKQELPELISSILVSNYLKRETKDLQLEDFPLFYQGCSFQNNLFTVLAGL